MHGPAVIIDAAAVVRREIVHAGQRRDAGQRDLDAREDAGLHVEDGLLARPDGEAKGRGRARAVEQRMDHQRSGAGKRPLQPEGAEQRKFLAGRIGGLDGEAARREAVAEVLGRRPGNSLRRGMRRARRRGRAGSAVGDPEAGEAQVFGRRRLSAQGVAEREQVGAVGDGSGSPVGHLEQVHARSVQEAAVEGLELDRQPCVPPQGALGIVADVAVLVVAEAAQRPRQGGVGRAVRAGRELARHGPHGLGIEGRRPGRGARLAARRARASRPAVSTAERDKAARGVAAQQEALSGEGSFHPGRAATDVANDGRGALFTAPAPHDLRASTWGETQRSRLERRHDARVRRNLGWCGALQAPTPVFRSNGGSCR